VIGQPLLAEAVRNLAERPHEQRAVLAVHLADETHRARVLEALVVEPAARAQPAGVAVERLEMLERAFRIVALREVQNRALLLVGLDVLPERLESFGDAVENRDLPFVQEAVGA